MTLTPTFSAAKALFRVLWASGAWITGAVALAQDHPVDAFGKASVTAIDFRLSENNLDPMGLGASLSVMQERIIKNLAEWNFPLHPKPGKAYSHRMVAVVGRIAHQNTPVGFSFNAGNSDPRASEFQKADVIHVSCSLISITKPQQTVEQTMEFDAHPIAEALAAHRDNSIVMAFMADRASTVCFNLLDDLDLEKSSQSTKPALARPGWMPEIRIETQMEQPAAGNKPGAPVKPEQSEHEGRKQIIIHNQGSPVIFKLGHDRL